MSLLSVMSSVSESVVSAKNNNFCWIQINRYDSSLNIFEYIFKTAMNHVQVFDFHLNSKWGRHSFDLVQQFIFLRWNSLSDEVSLSNPTSKLNNLLGMNKLLLLWKQLEKIIIGDFHRCLSLTLYPFCHHKHHMLCKWKSLWKFTKQ